MNELGKKIQNSVAFKALKDEQRILKKLNKLGWAANQGTFYSDASTDKIREIDVIGNKSFRNNSDADSINSKITLVIESKSLSNYHLLFSGNYNSFHNSFAENEFWIGYEDEALEKINKALINLNLPKEQITQILIGLNKLSFPDEMMLTSDFRICPFPIDNNFTAFSETNIAKEKGIEASVLWKAQSALKSCIQSFKNQIILNLITDLTGYLEYEINYNQEDMLVEPALFELKYAPNTIHFFHPIISIESSLWSTMTEKPQLLKWCRFYQNIHGGSNNWWVDIVTKDDIPEYLEKITDYYNNEMKSRIKN